MDKHAYHVYFGKQVIFMDRLFFLVFLLVSLYQGPIDREVKSMDKHVYSMRIQICKILEIKYASYEKCT